MTKYILYTFLHNTATLLLDYCVSLSASPSSVLYHARNFMKKNCKIIHMFMWSRDLITKNVIKVLKYAVNLDEKKSSILKQQKCF